MPCYITTTVGGSSTLSSLSSVVWVTDGTTDHGSLPYWSNTSGSTYTNTSVTCATGSTFFWGDEEVTPTAYMALARGRVVYCRERTEREQREEAERMAIRQREAEERAERLRIAKERSKELLLSHLTKEQRRTLEENGWFMVLGGQSNRRYRIRGHGSIVANIDIMDGELVNGRLCCHCNHNSNVPIYDHLLAQKLHLQYNEPAFLQMANRHA